MEQNITREEMSTEKGKIGKNEFGVDMWTESEKELSKSRYGCEILKERCSPQDAKDSNLPLDAYLVSYFIDGKLCYDITRTSKQSSLFDMYWDKFRDNLKGFKWADGKVNPKLWGYRPPDKKKRK